MKKLLRNFLIINFFFIPLLSSFSTPAQARLDILPRKIVIESRDRSGELTILNLFDQESTFRLDLLNFRQDENGIYTTMQSPLNPLFNPDDAVRFSPRQFVLTPGGRQKVRLSVRKPANLPDGEYRFHIKALRLAQPNINNPTNNGDIAVMANIGVSIPVIVRHGNVSATATIKDVRLVDPNASESKTPELHMTIERSGNASTLGQLEVIWEKNGAKPIIIGKVSNMNIFTEITKRSVKVSLSELPYGTGTIRVRYVNDQEQGEIYDEVTLQR